jgi:hypothetical protein
MWHRNVGTMAQIAQNVALLSGGHQIMPHFKNNILPQKNIKHTNFW